MERSRLYSDSASQRGSRSCAGRQVEGFLDVSHFAFVHTESFGERENPEVPDYPVERLPHGFRAAGCQHCEQLSAQSKASESAWV
jgi:hypothetical protein